MITFNADEALVYILMIKDQMFWDFFCFVVSGLIELPIISSQRNT